MITTHGAIVILIACINVVVILIVIDILDSELASKGQARARTTSNN